MTQLEQSGAPVGPPGDVSPPPQRMTFREGYGALGRRITLQRLVTVAVILLCGGLVLYPLIFLSQVALNVGDPRARPPQEYGLGNFTALFQQTTLLRNTFTVAAIATVIAIPLGFLLAWVLYRTRMPGKERLAQILVLPYYVTPLVGALAWASLAAPRGGFINQIWRALGGSEAIVNIHSPFGIAWVMALFEGAVAFVMISAAMKSMDPSLEESSQMLGASKGRTLVQITLPLLRPAVLGATIFVFAEMMGAFAAPLVLGSADRYFVLTTAIYQSVLSFPPNLPRAAAMGLSLFGLMFIMMFMYQRLVRSGNFVTVTGKAFRPRDIEMGRLTPIFMGLCLFYVFLAVVLPMGALLITSLQQFATAFLGDAAWTFDHYSRAIGMGPVRLALRNSMWLGVATATTGVALMGFLAWLIYRSPLPPRAGRVMEYVVMFPLAVPRMVFGLGLLWAWLVIPIPIYGTLWLLWLAYLTVFLPLGVRTIGGVIFQMDRSLEECARVCGASRLYQLRTVSMPLLKPGLVGAWLLLFIASVRELGTSILLVGPHSKVIGPAVVEAWSTSGKELTAAMAMLQVLAVFAALVLLIRIGGKRLTQQVE